MSSYRVTNPKTNTSTVLPSESVARAYARSIKGAIVEPCEVVCKVTVTKCAEGTLEAQRAATRYFYRGGRSDESERAAERYVETVTQARLYGASVSDALDEGRDAMGGE